jgi:hypothetical protein
MIQDQRRDVLRRKRATYGAIGRRGSHCAFPVSMRSDIYGSDKIDLEICENTNTNGLARKGSGGSFEVPIKKTGPSY